MLTPGESIDVQLVPGITAALSCASLLGAPLGHDFATLSLSDLLCPWPWIEERATLLAKTDLAVVLYNVQSGARQEGVYRILDIFLKHRPNDIWCGTVRNAYREEQKTDILTLKELRSRQFDMLTSIVIGTRFTKRTGTFLFAPRGYHGWKTEQPLPKEAIWFFTGTRDGNALASQCSTKGVTTVVSVASEHGAVQAKKHSPDSAVLSGRIGRSARENLLVGALARGVVDATHPFATVISTQLMEICEKLGIPYLRFNRPPSVLPANTILAATIDEAASNARNMGRRVFISTGVKDLGAFTKYTDCEWFARVTPGPDSLEKALAAGIPSSNLCAMQGPFSQRANETLWTDWSIDCVVTKDSGDTGGLPEKIAAAKALEIPLIVVQRPVLKYSMSAEYPEEVLQWVMSLRATR
jgi:precorrin-3B C17-methyltransferase